MYVADSYNGRVQSFPITTSSGSPNGTTILGEFPDGSNYSMYVTVDCMAFDRIRNLLYLCISLTDHLLILNTTENNVVIITDSELSVINRSIQIHPSGIVIDETSDIFYVSDDWLRIVVKFEIGSTTGIIVAGRMVSNSFFNQLNTPQGLALDSSGYLYIVDFGLNRIVQLLNDYGDFRVIAGELYLHNSYI